MPMEDIRRQAENRKTVLLDEPLIKKAKKAKDGGVEFSGHRG